MLYLQSSRSLCKGLLAGKRPRDVCQGPQASLVPVSPNDTIVLATIKSHASGIFGKVGGISTEIMLDSGSSVSLLSQDTDRSHSTTTTSNTASNSIRRVFMSHPDVSQLTIIVKWIDNSIRYRIAGFFRGGIFSRISRIELYS